MISQRFQIWVRNKRLIRAAEIITAYESARGNRGVTYQTLQYWLAQGIPPGRVASVEAVTGIPRGELRPDIFGAVVSQDFLEAIKDGEAA